MTRKFKLAIVRVRNDTSVPVLPDQACLGMLMTGPASLLRFWEDTTYGWLDFLDSAMLPWVDVSLTAATIGSRNGAAEAAFQAVRAAYPGADPLAGFDGAFVVVHPGRMAVPNPKAGQPGEPATVTAAINGGAITGGVPLRFAIIAAETSDFTFMSHELGHVLGFEHTFGLDNNGTDYDPNDGVDVVGPEYGSPYDLMSSATFGTHGLGTGSTWFGNPTFAGTPVAGWPAASATSTGPHLSRANLHRWFPGALESDHTVHRDFPAPGAVMTARIVAASSPAGNVLVLHPPGEPESGVGRVYVEYRDGRGWDRGMDVVGTDLAKVGVVVHSLEDTAVGPRIWYRGSIPTGSVDTDLAVFGTQLVVSVDAVGVDGQHEYADISYRVSIDTAVSVTTAQREEIVLGGSGTPVTKQTPCGDTVTWGTWDTTTTEHFLVRTTGLGGAVDRVPAPAATASWTLGGVALPGGSGQVEVPFDGVTFPVDYQIDSLSFELTLSTASGGVRFTADVVATVTVGPDTRTSAPTPFVSRGWFDSYQPEDIAKIVGCLSPRLVQVGHPDLIPQLVFPTPPPEGVAAMLWRQGALARLAVLPLDAGSMSALQSLVLLQAPPELDPPLDADGLLAALATAGVDFSVDEGELRGWLADPVDTPYPAVATALLGVLAGRRLGQPAYLDVIVYDYENSPGIASPRAVVDVDLDVLRGAVVAAFNERNDAQETAFDALVS